MDLSSTMPPHATEAKDVHPDPEVDVRPKRRRFAAAYKQSIVEQADACSSPGEIGALLRKEGLYSSHLSVWRQERKRGELTALSAKKRGRKAAGQTSIAKEELARLRVEVERLTVRLQKAELIIEVQKKVSQLLGIATTASSDEATS
jgi:transposase